MNRSIPQTKRGKRIFEAFLHTIIFICGQNKLVHREICTECNEKRLLSTKDICFFCHDARGDIR